MFGNIKNRIREILKEHRIGELLIERGLITEQQLEEALKESLATGERIGKTLTRLGYISNFQLYRRIIMQWQLRFGTLGIVLMLQIIAPITAYSDNISGFGEHYKISHQIKSADRAQIEQPKIFGYKEFKSDNIATFNKWTNAIERFDNQLDNLYMPSAKTLLWQEELESLKSKGAKKQLAAINKIINTNHYIEDKDNYEKSDYWATPIELFNNGGDCEDFAIAKYASLKALGFSPDQMRITIVKDTIKDIHHAVLIVNLDGENFVLDNQSKNIEAIATVTRYEPIFSINSNSWWLHEKA